MTDEIEVDYKAEYDICQRRGHDPEPGFMTASNPPQNVCKWCGTYYWYTNPKPELREGWKRGVEMQEKKNG